MAIHDPSTGPSTTAPVPSTPVASAERAMAPRSTPRSTPRASWLRAGAAAPPARRQRRPWVRLLVALTSSTALLLTAALVAAAAIVPPIGARRTAREAAQQEVASQLGTDERVVARTFASQRRWTDMWRESFGVVVATNRRLLYVGAPPTPLLRPREDGPTELLVESYPYDAAFTLEPRTLVRGSVRGLVLRTPTAQVDFLVDDGSWISAVRVSQAAAAARQAVTRDEEALTATTRAPAPPAERYESYIVQRGETLTGLARRFRSSPDVLRQLNQLPTDEIKVGQRLRVPKVDVDTLP
jgi:LysM repeat protein